MFGSSSQEPSPATHSASEWLRNYIASVGHLLPPLRLPASLEPVAAMASGAASARPSAPTSSAAGTFESPQQKRQEMESLQTALRGLSSNNAHAASLFVNNATSPHLGSNPLAATVPRATNPLSVGNHRPATATVSPPVNSAGLRMAAAWANRALNGMPAGVSLDKKPDAVVRAAVGSTTNAAGSLGQMSTGPFGNTLIELLNAARQRVNGKSSPPRAFANVEPSTSSTTTLTNHVTKRKRSRSRSRRRSPTRRRSRSRDRSRRSRSRSRSRSMSTLGGYRQRPRSRSRSPGRGGRRRSPPTRSPSTYRSGSYVRSRSGSRDRRYRRSRSRRRSSSRSPSGRNRYQGRRRSKSRRSRSREASKRSSQRKSPAASTLAASGTTTNNKKVTAKKTTSKQQDPKKPGTKTTRQETKPAKDGAAASNTLTTAPDKIIKKEIIHLTDIPLPSLPVAASDTSAPTTSVSITELSSKPDGALVAQTKDALNAAPDGTTAVREDEDPDELRLRLDALMSRCDSELSKAHPVSSGSTAKLGEVSDQQQQAAKSNEDGGSFKSPEIPSAAANVTKRPPLVISLSTASVTKPTQSPATSSSAQVSDIGSLLAKLTSLNQSGSLTIPTMSSSIPGVSSAHASGAQTSLSTISASCQPSAVIQPSAAKSVCSLASFSKPGRPVVLAAAATPSSPLPGTAVSNGIEEDFSDLFGAEKMAEVAAASRKQLEQQHFRALFDVNVMRYVNRHLLRLLVESERKDRILEAPHVDAQTQNEANRIEIHLAKAQEVAAVAVRKLMEEYRQSKAKDKEDQLKEGKEADMDLC